MRSFTITTCPHCNQPSHPPDDKHPSLDPSDLCPQLSLLNERLADEVAREVEHRAKGLPYDVLYEPPEGLPGLSSYTDYVVQRAYVTGAPLRPDQVRWLKAESARLGSRASPRNWWAAKTKAKVNVYDKRFTQVQSDLVFRFKYYKDIWKMNGIDCGFTLPEYVEFFETTMVCSLDHGGWMGTLSEMIRSKSFGGLGATVRLFRVNPELPLSSANVIAYEGMSRSLRAELYRSDCGPSPEGVLR